jgi:PAS domain S-box-containing protein
MSAVWLVDGLSLLASMVGLVVIVARKPPSLASDTRRVLIGLYILILINYGFYGAYELGGPYELIAAADFAQIMVPLAFFFFFYTFLKSQANRELQASEERHRALFESSFDGILIADLEGGQWDANPALCRMHGYTREAFLKTDPWNYIHPEDRQVMRFFREAIRRNENYSGFGRGIRRDGSFYRGEIKAGLVNFAGQPHIMAVIRDVTERDESREAQERLVAVLDATTDLVGTSEPNGRSIYMNRAGRAMLGIGQDEDIRNLETREFHTPESFRRIIGHGMKTAIREGIWRGETELKSRDGRIIDVSQVIVAHRDAGGEISYLSTIARDISDARRAADELKASERRLFRFMEHLPVGVLINQADRKPYLLNRIGREMLGIKNGTRPAESDPAEFYGLYRSGTQERYPLSELPSNRVLDGQRIEVHDLEIRRDGRVIPLEVWASPVRNDRDEITHALVAFMDITERRKAEQTRRRLEEQLLQSQKMESIGMLAGGVAHDFNNLLVAIVGYSEMILADEDKALPFREEIEEIRRSGDRATALTRQLLAFSRKQVLQPEVLNLNQVVRDIERLLKRVIGERIDLISFLHPGTVFIEADPVQLEQVIVNLAVNARDAMPEGGRLVFETGQADLTEEEARLRGLETEGPFVTLSVSDTGCGIDEAIQRKIFEPFFTTKGRDKGTGLGLSTVFGIVKQSGGDIEVQSAPGEGSRFVAYFPLVDRLPGSVVAMNGVHEKLSHGSETVLLVEDEAAPRILSARVLREAGYTVIEAVSGEAALEASRGYEETIDVLLTDVVLPGLGGGELAEQLVQERPALQVLYTSGYADNAIVRRAVHEGGAFLQKPFTPRELALAVRRVIDGD